MTQLGRRLGATVTAITALTTLLGTVAPAAAHERYRVRKGDTLLDVAARLGVDPGALAAANGIADPDVILAGQTLVVPPRGASGGGSSGPGTAGSYRVQPGDTLADLAPRLGVSPRRLAEVNSLANPNRIVAGQTLSVPQAGRPATTASGSSARATGRWRCPVAGARFVDDFGYVKPTGQVHQGIDLYAPGGTPVVAPVGGVVTAFPNRLGGKAVHLSGDDGNRYYGAHLARYGRTGRVSAGTVIGYVGNSGDAVGGPTHLHFEMHPGGGAAVSPYSLLTGACR